MAKSVKTLVFISILSLFFTSSSAQLKLPIAGGVAPDVKKVIEDYPNLFIHLMGEMIMENTQSTDYQCNFKVKGAEEATITRYPSKKEICSWQALMLTTEDFDKAKQKFKALYTQLNNLSATIAKENFRLRGDYEAPQEEKKFTSVLFSLDPKNEAVKKLKVEIVMEFVIPMEWKVKILVYDREREDVERGKTVEE